MNENNYKNLNEKEKKQYSILWVIFILFGLVWLWIIFKPTKDFTPDLSTPDNGQMEEVGPGGYPY